MSEQSWGRTYWHKRALLLERALEAVMEENIRLRTGTYQPVGDGTYPTRDPDDLPVDVENAGNVLVVWAHDTEEPFCIPLCLPDDLRLCRYKPNTNEEQA